MFEFVSGAAFWGVAREIFAYYFKKREDKKSSVNKIISQEILDLTQSLLKVQEMALRYYSKPGLSDAALSLEIKIHTTQMGVKFSGINNSLKSINFQVMPDYLMINFRRAMTNDLDSARRPAWALDSHQIDRLLSATSSLERELKRHRLPLV